MTKRLILILILSLALVFAPAPRPLLVMAQGITCSPYDFPQSFGGWTIAVGHIDTQNVVQFGSPNQIDVTLTLSTPVYITSISFQTYSIPQTDTRNERVILYDPNFFDVDPADPSRYAVFYEAPDSSAPVWRVKTAYFASIATNEIRFIINESSSIALGLNVIAICASTLAIVTVTSSPTITNTPAPTATPTPDLSPTPSETPTPSNTPVTTDTPGGPTATGAPTTTATGAGVQTGKFIFNTVVPPNQCTDPLNPCGAMPYPVPQMPTLALASPVPSTAIAQNATPTLYPTWTPFGTPGATAGPGTSTPTPGPADQFFAYATSISDQLGQIQATPGLIVEGQLLDIQNGANQIGEYAGNFFAIVKALQSFFLGKTGNIVAILILIAGFVILLKLLLWSVPIIRSIAMFIVSFIP